MMIKKWLFGSLFLLGTVLAPGPVQQAQETIMTAQVCAVATIGCPAVATIDAGIRGNGVNYLRYNTYALLPFTYTDATPR